MKRSRFEVIVGINRDIDCLIFYCTVGRYLKSFGEFRTFSLALSSHAIYRYIIRFYFDMNSRKF